MTEKERKERIIKIVRSSRGDDLERATMAFSQYTPEQLDKEYGQSGQTCRQILESYQREAADTQEMVDWLIAIKV